MQASGKLLMIEAASLRFASTSKMEVCLPSIRPNQINKKCVKAHFLLSLSIICVNLKQKEQYSALSSGD